MERLYRVGYGFSRVEREAVYSEAFRHGKQVAGMLLSDLKGSRRKTA
jgi:hypothetical protein